MDENDLVLETPPLDDPLDSNFKEKVEEISYIFEEVPELPLENPPFGTDLISPCDDPFDFGIKESFDGIRYIFEDFKINLRETNLLCRIFDLIILRAS